MVRLSYYLILYTKRIALTGTLMHFFYRITIVSNWSFLMYLPMHTATFTFLIKGGVASYLTVNKTLNIPVFTTQEIKNGTCLR